MAWSVHMRALPSLLLALVLVPACDDKDKASPLESRAESAQAPSAKESAPPPAPDAKAGAKALVGGPAPAGPKVELALALPADTTYVINTVGNTEFPLIANQVAFAREERVHLDDCSGEGSDRACTLTHRLTQYTSEGKAGKFFINDQESIEGLESTHRMTATGKREGETALSGPPEAVATARAQDLNHAHKFLCIRFPDEPVAKGAKWKDACQRRVRGLLTTRDVLWEVAEIEQDPGGETRVELRYIGKYSEPKKEGGTQEGTVQGILYFFADRGEPHILREQVQVTLDPKRGLRTKSTFNHTFGKVVPPAKKGGKETIVLTNGEPFPEGINVRPPQPDPAPNGSSAPVPADDK